MQDDNLLAFVAVDNSLQSWINHRSVAATLLRSASRGCIFFDKWIRNVEPDAENGLDNEQRQEVRKLGCRRV